MNVGKENVLGVEIFLPVQCPAAVVGMVRLSLSMACQDTDRTHALRDGRVAVEGCDLTFVSANVEEIFQRAFRHAEFDVSELSLSTHILTIARGDSRYIGIPAFVSRSFRHSAIYVRTDRGIDAPAALKGRRIGVPDFQQTAGVWVRGMLADEYGVQPADVRWRTGGLEQTGRTSRVAISLPPGLSVEAIGPDQTLSTLLEAGDLDAVISPRAPSCIARGAPVGRLFPDFRAAEEAYFRCTGMFPLMHIIGIRRDIATAHPWLPMNLFKAFSAAKALAMQEIAGTGVLAATHPWIAHDVARVQALMGADFWRYGVADNAKELQAMLRYARADGLIMRDVALDELFASSTCDVLRF
jgi:4,5-dihydroxyphthalate decarboxylase